MSIIITSYIMCLLLLMCTEYVKPLKKIHPLVKGINSIIFFILAMYSINQYGQNAYSIFALVMLGALVFCFLGDVLLALDKGTAETKFFYAGVASFALAHGTFFLGLSQITPMSYLDIIIVIAVVILVIPLLKLKILNLKGNDKIIPIYTIFIGLLMAKSITLYVDMGSSVFTNLMLLGATLFLISDIILLFVYFLKEKIKYLQGINWLFYYGATMIIAIAVGLQ